MTAYQSERDAARPDSTAGTGEHAERIRLAIWGYARPPYLDAKQNALASLAALVAAVREAEAERDEAQRELAVCENALREIAVSNGVEGYAGCTCGHRERMCHRWNAAVWCGAFDAPAAANAALAAVSGEAPTDE